MGQGKPAHILLWTKEHFREFWVWTVLPERRTVMVQNSDAGARSELQFQNQCLQIGPLREFLNLSVYFSFSTYKTGKITSTYLN